jgi:uncharacterized protein (DUF433 family)
MQNARDRAEVLIARWIKANPHKPQPEEAWVLPHSVSIWAVIAQLELDDWDRAGVADYYELLVEAVDAAIAYYELHRAAIDARIARNRAPLASHLA